MTYNEGIKVMGEYHVVLRDSNGRIKKEETFKNIIPNTGLAELAALACADVGGTGWDYIALGTDDTAAAAAQTALIAEITTLGGARGTGTGTVTTTTTTNDTFQLVKTFSFTGALILKEIGVFNDAAAGEMLSRQVMNFTAANGDSLQVTYKIIFARA